MDELSVIDLLKADPRPTILVDLHMGDEPDSLQASFINEALRSWPTLWDNIIATSQAARAFGSWILGAPASSESSPVVRPFSFCGVTWTQFTVASRWRIISGLQLCAFSASSSEEGLVETALTPGSEATTPTNVTEPLQLSLSNSHPGRAFEPIVAPTSPMPVENWSKSFHELLKSMMMDTRIAEMSTIGMFDFWPSGKLRQANESWFKSSGLSRDPAAASEFSFMDCVFDEDLELVKYQWDTLTRGIPATFEMRWKAADCEAAEASSNTRPTWVSAACMPIMAEDGTVASISGFTVDITAQKRSAQDALERAEAVERAESSEKKFTRFAEQAPVAVFMFDAKSRMIYCNSKWFEMTGCPPMNFADIEWDRWVLEEDMASVGEAVRTLYEDKIPITVDCRLKRPWNSGDVNMDGPAWLSTAAYPEIDEDGTVSAVTGTMTEVSRYKWAERVHEMRRDEALESKRQQENFIDMTSHEMRNPLSAVVHSADLLSASLTQMRAIVNPASSTELSTLFDGCIECVQTIISCSVHQKRIVDDILTLSKLDSRLLTIAPIKVQPSSIVQDAFKMFETEARSVDVNLHFKEDSSLAQLGVDWVMMDPSRVLQVLINLLTNAIKFTRLEAERNVTVTIKASAERPAKSEGYISKASLEEDTDAGDQVYIHFMVQDTGRGLSLDEQAGLFNRFRQASPRTHIKYGGSGLGLFVSRELAELQGGAIKVTSNSKSGSIFAFYIKCRRASAPRHRNPVQQISATMHTQGSSSSIEKITVLIVEDNIVNQRVLSKLLAKRGCEVYAAGNGVEALEVLAKTKYSRNNRDNGHDLSIVLMDIEMPVMGGLECTATIRRMEEAGDLVGRMPIVAMSANARKEQIERTIEMGCDDFLSKPFRIQELVDKIERLVSGRRKE